MKKLVLTQNMVVDIKQTLIDGLTIASGSKSSATYYHSKDEQMNAIRDAIKAQYRLSKELPLIIATQKGATGRYVSEVLLNEFKQTTKGGACNIVNPIDWYDNGLSDKAILTALRNLASDDNGITYVLRLFVDLKNEKVNNERARKIALGFIWGQENLEFYAVKYRNKISEILKHVYGEKKTSVLLQIARKQIDFVDNMIATEKEMNIVNESVLKYYNGDAMKAFKLLLFLFRDVNFLFNENEFPILSEYQKAKTDITGIQVIPEEVLLGLISDVKHPQYHTMWSTELQREATKAMIRKNVKVTSVNQQVRQTKSTAKLGVEKTVDLKKATDFLALYKTGYETGFSDEIQDAINGLAEKKKITGFHYQNIGVVQDKSASMKGHKQESKNTPRAIADFTSLVLRKSAQKSVEVTTDGEITDIASAFVKLLKTENADEQFDAIFILTDGYENAYDGLTNEVLEIWRAETGRNTPIFQISPITSAEMGSDVRTLGHGVVTMAINNPSALQPQIAARLLEIDTKRWLENQVQSLEAAPVKRSKKININA
jgi:hypothetical protein